ncbi:YciI family protein [Domibacillus robiginosus]|uniref:YciI family protein n=1 Tax=Domibacillus robiginosus TaxID=1071054 RepID=UPI00067B8DD2|nr:YciI family protein [Domibacillus robiginosus]
MAYYAALLHMIDPEKNKEVRPLHLDYLAELEKENKVFAKGPFADGSGGMVVYVADTYEEALQLAENDPAVTHQVRRLELKEWIKN